MLPTIAAFHSVQDVVCTVYSFIRSTAKEELTPECPQIGRSIDRRIYSRRPATTPASPRLDVV